MHPFMNHSIVVNRLVQEWRTFGKLIIAYDFDNTVFDYHNQGHDYSEVIELLHKCKVRGAYLIVFTAREEESYPEIKEFLNSKNIPFDTINEQPDFLLFKGRKIYYNILLDDRAGLESACRTLSDALHIVCTD